MLENEPTIDDMWVLTKIKPHTRHRLKVSGDYLVGAKRSWINAKLEVKDSYEVLAEHHDRAVLEKMMQLAIEGDKER